MYIWLLCGIFSCQAFFNMSWKICLLGLHIWLCDCAAGWHFSDKNYVEHLRYLEEMLKKSIFTVAEVMYFGNVIIAEGVTPMKINVQAIHEALRSQKTKHLKSYLGMMNYYDKFLPRLSTILAPLHKLFTKND